MNSISLKSLFTQKPYLAWYIKNTDQLSDEGAVEHLLNYGQWEDYLLAEKELGITKIKNIFDKLKNAKRTNLRPQTINYFEKYFEKYA